MLPNYADAISLMLPQNLKIQNELLNRYANMRQMYSLNAHSLESLVSNALLLGK